MADELLVVGDACRPSGVGIEDLVHERLYAAGSVEDVLVALAPLLGLQKEVGIVEYARIAHQYIDRRLELLLDGADEGTADGLAGLSAAAGFLQLQELLLQPLVLIMTEDEHTHEQGDD